MDTCRIQTTRKELARLLMDHGETKVAIRISALTPNDFERIEVEAYDRACDCGSFSKALVLSALKVVEGTARELKCSRRNPAKR